MHQRPSAVVIRSHGSHVRALVHRQPISCGAFYFGLAASTESQPSSSAQAMHAWDDRHVSTARVPALDGLRCVAILLVLLVHFAATPSPDWPALLLFFISGHGWLGVDLFFVLSGFLITSVLIHSKASPGYFRNFFARRAIRIWPLCYLMLLLAFVAAPHVPALLAGAPQPGDLLPSVFFFQNVNMVTTNGELTWFAPMWSLSVEEQVYLVLPVVVLLCSSRPRLVAAFCTLIAMALGWRYASHLLGGPDLANYLLAPARLDAFAVGGFVAASVHTDAARARVATWAPRVFWFAGAVLLLASVTTYGLDYKGPLMGTWGYTVSAMFFGSALAWVRDLLEGQPLLARVFPAAPLWQVQLRHLSLSPATTRCVDAASA
jgi:peptidoglycan/LPS O-acetylase OafA/YrhL